MSRKTVIGIVTVATIGIATMTAFSQTADAPDADFDSAAWIAEAGNGEQINPRGTMIKAAIAALPLGSTKDEVVAVLGQPDETGDWWVYYAGSEGLPVTGDMRLLIVEFSADGTVSRVVESTT